MSFDVNSVVGQGSIRPAQQQTQSQSADRRRQEVAQAAQQSRQRSENRDSQISAETQARQERDAAIRAQEKQAVEQASREDVEREVQQALAELKDINLTFNHKLKYTIDRDENELIVKVIDPDTDEIIKELPPLAMQKFHSRLQEFIGLLVDEEA